MKKTIKKAGKREVPNGVKIIAVFYYISLALGILLFSIVAFSLNNFSQIVNPNLLVVINMFYAGFLLYFSLGFGGWPLQIVPFVLLAYLSGIFMLGRGLQKGQSWTRIVAIIFACLNILISFPFLIIILSVPTSELVVVVKIMAPILFVFNIWMAGYLLFNKNAKQFFA